MQKISRDKFIREDWLKNEEHDVFLIRIEDGLIFPLASIEVWEDCPLDEYRYRILEYWKWSTPINDLLYDYLIIGAILSLSGKEAPVLIKEEREHDNVYEEFTVSHQVIFGMDEHEIEHVLPYFSNGEYVIITNF